MEEQSKSLHNILLVVILLGALLIRIMGIFPGHPTDHPDEPMSTGSALEMVTNDDLNPRRFDYPAGVPILHYGIYRSVIIPFLLLKNPTWIPSAAIEGGVFFKEHSVELFGKNGIDALYWSRYITAVLGTATVFLTYLIARSMFHLNVGLIAAFLTAFNYRHVLSSQLALSDIPNNFFVLLSFYLSWLVWQQNTMVRYIAAAIAVAFSLSIKYQFFAIIPFLFAHFAVTLKKGSTTKLFDKNFLIALVLIPIIFVIINPYLFLNLKTALPVIQIVSARYGFAIQKFNFYPLFYLYHWGLSKLPFITVATGFIVSLFIFPFKTTFLLSYIAPFLYMFLYYAGGGVYVRNFTTVIPLFFIFSGILLQKLFPKFLILPVVLAINLVPLKNSIKLVSAYTESWSRDTLVEWAKEQLPTHATVLNDNISLPTSMENQITLISWGKEQGNAITELMDSDIDFAVVNVAWNYINFFWHGLPMSEMMKYPGVPVPILKDSYRGLLLSEYLRYTVYELYKPWQAPENAYLVIKIPKVPQSKGVLIHSTSQTFPVTPGNIYTVEADVSDGFIRVDFSPIEAHAVSGMNKGRVVTQAPKGATRMTVSAQSATANVRIYESTTQLEERFPKLPYITPTISDRELFPIGIY